MNEMGRYHKLIEQQVDIFIEICKRHVIDKGLSDKIWVTKDEVMSAVSIGNPDKMPHNRDFGFTMYYESIVPSIDNAVEEFVFKLDHFIKVAHTSDRYAVFKNGKTSQADRENRQSQS
jgi:hypothetical protein